MLFSPVDGHFPMGTHYPFDLNELIAICKENRVLHLGIFGSMARGDYKENSDIDILVEFAEPIGLFAMAHLKSELTEKLGREADIVTEAGISPYTRERILSELRIIF